MVMDLDRGLNDLKALPDVAKDGLAGLKTPETLFGDDFSSPTAPAAYKDNRHSIISVTGTSNHLLASKSVATQRSRGSRGSEHETPTRQPQLHTQS